MNRSILIVICDFLLVSLLAFSTVDINTVAQGGAPQMMMKTEPANFPATNQTGVRQDLGDVMRLALTEERKSKDALFAELTATRSALNSQQTILGQRQSQVQSYQAQLQAQTENAEQLQQQQTNLEVQFAAAQTNIQNLGQQLQASTAAVEMSKEDRAALDAEARRQAEKAAALQAQLDDLQQSNRAVALEKDRLNSELQLAEADKAIAAGQLAKVEEEVDVRREENEKLAAGVQALATNSSELAREVRQARPLAANEIFDDLASNHVQVTFSGSRAGIFGRNIDKSTISRSVLVTDGSNTFALCHLEDTPLTLWNPGTDWHELDVRLDHHSVTETLDRLSFSVVDPRIVVLPVSADQAKQLGCKVYQVSPDPYKFQDAVVVGASEGYYGECSFQIDLSTPFYLKMDHNSLKGLFGKFNPSSGDFVFSKSGELLGIMANDTYCALIRDAHAEATFGLGPKAIDQKTAAPLADIYAEVSGLPLKLQ